VSKRATKNFVAREREIACSIFQTWTNFFYEQIFLCAKAKLKGVENLSQEKLGKENLDKEKLEKENLD